MGVQANIADQIGIMYAGKIVEESTTEKIAAIHTIPTQNSDRFTPQFATSRAPKRARKPSLIDLPWLRDVVSGGAESPAGWLEETWKTS